MLRGQHQLISLIGGTALLSPRRTAALRAALAFWRDELAPHGRDAMRPYYDDPAVDPLDREEIEELRQLFVPERLRFARVDESGYVLNVMILE